LAHSVCTLNEPLSALVDELLAVLHLGFDASQFTEVFAVDRLEVLDVLDLRVFLLTDHYIAVFTVRRTFITHHTHVNYIQPDYVISKLFRSFSSL